MSHNNTSLLFTGARGNKDFTKSYIRIPRCILRDIVLGKVSSFPRTFISSCCAPVFNSPVNLQLSKVPNENCHRQA